MFAFILLSVFSQSLGQNITEAPKPPIAATQPKYINQFHYRQPYAWGGFGYQHPYLRGLPLNHGGIPYPYQNYHASAAPWAHGSHCAYFCNLPNGQYGCCDSANSIHPGTCPANPLRSECPATSRSSGTKLVGINRRSNTLMMGAANPLKCNADMDCHYSHRCCWDVCAGHRTCKLAEFRG